MEAGEEGDYIPIATLSPAEGDYIHIATLSPAEGDYIPIACLLYTSPSPRDRHASRMPSSA